MNPVAPSPQKFPFLALLPVFTAFSFPYRHEAAKVGFLNKKRIYSRRTRMED
jgi:hypothetical protein